MPGKYARREPAPGLGHFCLGSRRYESAQVADRSHVLHRGVIYNCAELLFQSGLQLDSRQAVEVQVFRE